MHCAQTRQSGQDDKRLVRGRDFLWPVTEHKTKEDTIVAPNTKDWRSNSLLSKFSSQTNMRWHEVGCPVEKTSHYGDRKPVGQQYSHLLFIVPLKELTNSRTHTHTHTYTTVDCKKKLDCVWAPDVPLFQRMAWALVLLVEQLEITNGIDSMRRFDTFPIRGKWIGNIFRMTIFFVFCSYVGSEISSGISLTKNKSIEFSNNGRSFAWCSHSLNSFLRSKKMCSEERGRHLYGFRLF
jgi:hypothetical protein